MDQTQADVMEMDGFMDHTAGLFHRLLRIKKEAGKLS